MLEVFLWAAAFLISLTVLLKASDIFTDSAEEIGLFLRLPSFIIGVTIVALGTSLPELVSSVFAVIGGASEIVIGTVVGSNITNIFLILGVAAIVGKTMKLNFEILNVDLPILMASAFLLAVMVFDGEFTLIESILSLVGLLIYLYRTISSEEERPKEDKRKIQNEVKKILRIDKFSDIPIQSIFMLFVGSFFIFFSAKYTIDSAVKLAEFFNLGKEVLGASIIALGTSLPELVVSFRAAIRGKGEIAVGNVLGSNIINALGVMGIAGLFGTMVIPSTILAFSLPIMLLATILYLFIIQDKEITNWEGGFLLVFYVLYLGKLLGFV